ncbi:hypothetical protein [Bifidobacterium breve]|uniref:hypothetical protein n=1 Tax=Bifidobacterium breve TaxID=1685 RepID=UPI0012FF5139|nr:hypothetical protein [Bifidobacterium breve]
MSSLLLSSHVNAVFINVADPPCDFLINYRNDEHCGLDVSVAPVILPSLAGGGRHGRSVHVAG